LLKFSRIQHIKKLSLDDKKILVVGKGPSSSLWTDKYLNDYFVIGINHVSTSFNTHAAHFTDYEHFLDQNFYSKFVICPAFMNYKNKTVKDLNSLIYKDDKMNFLYKEKRLFSYDIVTPDGFTTQLFKRKLLQENPFLFKYASGVLVVQLAICLNQKELFTLGIDGGTKYNIDFEHTKGNGLFLDEQLQTMNQLAEGKIKIIKL
jgi:hypothetical protein